jgi:glycosyltransferase involved in cell wall biosynthesis
MTDNNYIYTPLAEPIPISAQVWPEGTTPLVATSTLTYNHEPYIRDCLDGILMQKTTFPVRVVVFEDCSTDATREIVKEYQTKYPHLVVAVFTPHNTYGKPERREALKPYFEARAVAKYIALCEGDDYWTDPLKLQKQVEFLEENPEFGLVHADCHFYYHEKGIWEYNANKNLSNSIKIDSKEELFYRLVDADYKIRTATVLFRKDLLKTITTDTKTFLMGDTPRWLDFSQLTKFKYFDEVFAVYRILSNSASRSKNKKKQYRFSLSMAEMRVYYCYKYNYPINEKLKNRYNKALLTYLLFDPQFLPLYPLFEPNAFLQFKFKYSRYSILNIFFKIIWIFSRFSNLFANKLRII